MVSKSKEHNEEVLPYGDPEDQDYDPEEYKSLFYILAAKVNFTPLKTDLTIPRLELLGLLL